MTDEYKKGLITGLAMQPLYVTNAARESADSSGIIYPDGPCAELIPANVIIVKETGTE